MTFSPVGWKGLKQMPQGATHYHHREGLNDYVLVNGSFQLTSSSIILSSHKELPPAGFSVNDYIHYSSRISVIIDFVQTVRIPQCVLNPIPKRCWTLSHLIRLQESAPLRQLLQLLHYMLDNCWPIIGINQRLCICLTCGCYDSMLQYLRKAKQGSAWTAWNIQQTLCSSTPVAPLKLCTLWFTASWWFRNESSAFQVTEYHFCELALSPLWPYGYDHPVLHSQLQDGPVVHVTSVSATGSAKPVSSTALSLSVSLATNGLGPQLS